MQSISREASDCLSCPPPRSSSTYSYARDPPGFSVPWQPATVPAPDLLFFNRALALELGLDPDVLDGPDSAAIFAGNRVPEGAEPLAQAYAGHQFGGFSPQLGDGRALLLGEVIDPSGARRDLMLKDSGRMPFSRRGGGSDGLLPHLLLHLTGATRSLPHRTSPCARDMPERQRRWQS